MHEAAKIQRTIVIGAGIGGLAAAARLAHAGREVLVLDMAPGPGGKLRTLPSVAGPVDAGPTVLTLRSRLDVLFQSIGERLSEHLDLVNEPVLARHWWPDGSRLDLHADPKASEEAICAFSGSHSAKEFSSFCASSKRLFEAFEGPIMQAPKPQLGSVIRKCMTNPQLLWQMTPPRTLWSALERQFSDPRLVQLFARYATYVGGSPFESPQILSLIWHAEASGVWTIKGGMARLAHVLEQLAQTRGATFRYGARVTSLIPDGEQKFLVRLANDEVLRADSLLFNGDPAALTDGLLGTAAEKAASPANTSPRSLSAYVWAFAAEPEGVDLAHHNVFFNQDYRREFAAIADGQIPTDAALYVCAQDRGHGRKPEGPERFEIILNGPPAARNTPEAGEEYEKCTTVTFESLIRMGLRFSPSPGPETLTTPHNFATLFPGSAGSLYGRSPHGMMATFKRPVIRSAIPGLYLAGGGVHPGAGLPMALTSGLHAAEAILTDRASTSRSHRTATHGGMSMDYPKTARAASRSSPS